VELPSAKADSTGVTTSGLIVGVGICNGIEVTVGTVVGLMAQAFKMSRKDEIKQEAKGNSFKLASQRKSGISSIT
jgi:uncharacterized oligopeptide transporter (OPT) family protein